MIKAAVFDIGGVLEIVDEDLWQATLADSAQTGTEFWNAYCGELDVPLRDFVSSLRPELIVAALTNSADGAREEEERRYSFGSLFDVMIYSHEIGIEKPDAAIYEYTRTLLGVEPHEIVFLDDRQSAVDAARDAGWHALLHTSTPASIAAIRALTHAN